MLRSVAFALCLLGSACHSHADTAVPHSAPPRAEALGDAGCFPVVPGTVVEDLAALDRASLQDRDSAGRGWVESGRDRVALLDGERSLVLFEAVNRGAAIVVLRAELKRLRVVGTYSVCWGGLGVSVTTVGRESLEGGRSALLLFALDARTRGYYPDPNDESSRIPSGVERTWVALTIREQGLVLAAPEFRSFESIRVARGASPLVIACRTQAKNAETFAVDRTGHLTRDPHPAPCPDSAAPR